jgi:hypothetical protein
VVAGDFIGHQPVFLIAGDSEKRQLVVRGGKERKRREEREKNAERVYDACLTHTLLHQRICIDTHHIPS